MAAFDRFSIKVVAGVGLCGAAIALSPNVAAALLNTGGYACMQGAAGEVAAPAIAGGAAVCAPAAA
ncbi:MAG: beta-xylosidase, partial [Mycobacterium sp.]